MTECRPLDIHGQGHVIGLKLRNSLKKHQRKAVNSVGRLAVFSRHGRRQGMKTAVDERVAVDDH